jgi:MSHA pilin protein MshC
MCSKADGFSLVELVTILVIVGVLSVVALPRMFDRSVFEARGFFDDALASVRYAQKFAIATGCDVQVQFTATGYSVTRRAACSSGGFSVSVRHPTRAGGLAGTAPSGVSVVPATSLYFDKIGRPRSSGGSLLGSVSRVSVGGITLDVEPQTGFAHES